MNRGNILGYVAAMLLAAAGWAIFMVAPDEATMGAIQRIFYLHLGSAATAFLAFFIVFIANIAYLAKRAPKWDWVGVSAAEVGLVFCTIVLISGPIWAKPVWGIWWTWDARLTSTFVLWIMYVGYLLLRGMVEDTSKRARLCAIFGIFAFLDVPLVYMSNRIWRTQHPQPVIAGGEGSGLAPEMWRVLLLTFFALVTLMAVMIRQRYRLEQLRHEAEELAIERELQVRDSEFQIKA